MGENIGQGKKLLIADDEPFLLRLTALNFENMGFDVTTVQNGREAIQALVKQDFDACILDIMMPYVDGMEVLQWIRTNPTTENIPVIILTVKAQDDQVEKAYRYGADLYLTKPYSQDDIYRCAELISQHSF